jgi:hypothetical protein
LERSGDLMPVAEWPVRHLTPAFELLLQPGESQPTYLRVAHNYPISVHWQLSEPDSFHDKSKRWHLLLGCTSAGAADRDDERLHARVLARFHPSLFRGLCAGGGHWASWR